MKTLVFFFASIFAPTYFTQAQAATDDYKVMMEVMGIHQANRDLIDQIFAANAKSGNPAVIKLLTPAKKQALFNEQMAFIEKQCRSIMTPADAKYIVDLFKSALGKKILTLQKMQVQEWDKSPIMKFQNESLKPALAAKPK